MGEFVIFEVLGDGGDVCFVFLVVVVVALFGCSCRGSCLCCVVWVVVVEEVVELCRVDLLDSLSYGFGV